MSASGNCESKFSFAFERTLVVLLTQPRVEVWSPLPLIVAHHGPQKSSPFFKRLLGHILKGGGDNCKPYSMLACFTSEASRDSNSRKAPRDGLATFASFKLRTSFVYFQAKRNSGA